MSRLGLSRGETLTLCLLLATGLGIRVVLAFATYGVPFDIRSAEIVAGTFHAEAIGPYDTERWPYPGGFLPFIAAADWVSRATGISFDGLYQLPAIIADIAIAWLVALALRWRGATSRTIVAGAGVVALGPSFIVISGYHGQIDSVGAALALGGVLLWTRDRPRRAPASGLLTGLAASMKQPPGFAALALLPSARSWRERAVVLGLTAVVPLVSLLPWLLTSPDSVISSMRQNNGVPGFGGLSGFAQPELTRWWATLDGQAPVGSDLVRSLWEAQRWFVIGGILVATALAWWRRLPPLHAASLIYLTVFVVNPNFAFQYLIWGLPFFAAAGYVRELAAFQVVILPATVLLYFRPGLEAGGWTYFVAVQAAWLCLVVALAVAVRSLVRQPTKPAPERRPAAVAAS